MKILETNESKIADKYKPSIDNDSNNGNHESKSPSLESVEFEIDNIDEELIEEEFDEEKEIDDNDVDEIVEIIDSIEEVVDENDEYHKHQKHSDSDDDESIASLKEVVLMKKSTNNNNEQTLETIAQIETPAITITNKGNFELIFVWFLLFKITTTTMKTLIEIYGSIIE